MTEQRLFKGCLVAPLLDILKSKKKRKEKKTGKLVNMSIISRDERE